MNHTLVEIKKADSIFEAHSIRGFLESHDIPCFISNEQFISVNWMYKHAVGGIRLNIFETDVQKANTLLLSIEEEKPNTQKQHQPFGRIFLSCILTFFSGIPTPLRKHPKPNRINSRKI